MKNKLWLRICYFLATALLVFYVGSATWPYLRGDYRGNIEMNFISFFSASEYGFNFTNSFLFPLVISVGYLFVAINFFKTNFFTNFSLFWTFFVILLSFILIPLGVGPYILIYYFLFDWIPLSTIIIGMIVSVYKDYNSQKVKLTE